MSGAPQIAFDAVDLDTATYPVVAHFYTIQGEGQWAGEAAYFIRLAGCDIGCPWCDTRESWSAEDHPEIAVASLVEEIGRTAAPLVVITGGEPAMHDLAPLTSALETAGRRIHLETSGAYPLTGRFDWITLSPKKYRKPIEDIYPFVHELKVVIFNRTDFKWAEEHAALCGEDVRLLLQPEWGSPHMLPEIVAYVKANPRWRVSLQTHKYLDIP